MERFRRGMGKVSNEAETPPLARFLKLQLLYALIRVVSRF